MPFLDLIEKIKDDDFAVKLIEQANNPYWVVKEIAQHDDFIERMITP